ncbi:MAG: cysteine-rich CWC family protein [Thiomonas sp.]
MTAPACNPARCPLCGESNRCALVDGEPADTPCWCSSVQIAPQTLAHIPASCRGVACICQRCATVETTTPSRRP